MTDTISKKAALRQNYINGQPCDALNGNTWQVLNPATETVIATVPFGNDADANRAVAAAIAAFPKWKAMNAWQRADILKKVGDIMRRDAQKLAAITVAEAGKPFAEAVGEWTVAAQFFDWFAEEGKRSYGRTIPASRNNKRMSVIYQPIGVVGIITAWNFPVWNVARVWAASLAAGCTFVAKPSEYTPLTAMALMDVLIEAGIPAGVANLVLGEADKIGNVLLERPEVRKIHFVGSTRVGKLLMENSGKTNTKLSLELGGNAPCLIFPDMNVDKMAKSAAQAKVRNCGQVCVSPQRFLVHRQIYDTFCTLTAQYLSEFRIGNGAELTSQVGPLINARQRETVAQVVAESVRQGAVLMCGGKIPAAKTKGFFYEPTLLKDVKPDCAIFRKEVFGPVMSVTPFDTLEEAVRLANDTEYGLAAYVWTNDLKTSIYTSESLEFGIVGINEWSAHGIEAPFGGWKQSGLGYECGEEGLHEYLEKKLIAIGDLS
jgi:acyl-CoA reductase-like NAD-dependent aldehyde dehydrogenase